MESVSSWWRARTARERGLLAIMVALIALVLGWLLVVRPLSDALDSAQRRHSEAVVALGEARARAESAHQEAVPTIVPLPLDSFLSRTAAEAGFTGTRIAGQGPQRASLTLEAARPQAFFGWVRDMEGRGLAVESLRARVNSDRTIAVEATFRARGS